jgi:hypothetical protein
LLHFYFGLCALVRQINISFLKKIVVCDWNDPKFGLKPSWLSSLCQLEFNQFIIISSMLDQDSKSF